MKDKVTVRYVPTQGSARTEEVATSESSVGEVLRKAKVNGKGHQVMLDGAPVTDMKTRVSAGAVLVVTEHARGS